MHTLYFIFFSSFIFWCHSLPSHACLSRLARRALQLQIVCTQALLGSLTVCVSVCFASDGDSVHVASLLFASRIKSETDR